MVTIIIIILLYLFIIIFNAIVNKDFLDFFFPFSMLYFLVVMFTYFITYEIIVNTKKDKILDYYAVKTENLKPFKHANDTTIYYATISVQGEKEFFNFYKLEENGNAVLEKIESKYIKISNESTATITKYKSNYKKNTNYKLFFVNKARTYYVLSVPEFSINNDFIKEKQN